MDRSGEDRLTHWIRNQLQKQNYDRIGDDGAILPSGPEWTVTTDQQIAEVHFPKDLPPRLIAGRLLAVNLSDIAAMGAVPSLALLALSCPSSYDVKDFFRALIKECGRLDIELAGGDLARSPELSATMTLFGRLQPSSNWLRRSNARPGDCLWIGGPLGQSAAGLRLVQKGARLQANSVVLPDQLRRATTGLEIEARRAIRMHLSPRPQLELGLWLARRPRVGAIDISDGLALDLHRLCRESQVGAEILAEELTMEASLTRLCQTIGLDPLATVLGGGEDYVLLFSLPADTGPPSKFGCRRIGTVTEGREVKLVQAGEKSPLGATGWDHFHNG